LPYSAPLSFTTSPAALQQKTGSLPDFPASVMARTISLSIAVESLREF
jgi:hypothetical protein